MGRLSKRDFLIVYSIIILIFFSLTSFLLGAYISKKQMEKQIMSLSMELERVKEEQTTPIKDEPQYLQTDFVNYYYNVLLPYEKFKEQQIQYINKLSILSDRVDQLALSSDMKEMTASVLTEVKGALISKSSPLLQQSQKEIVNALQSYLDGLSSIFRMDLSTSKPLSLLIPEMPQMTLGKTMGLKGQLLFYQAMVKWEEIYVTKKKSSPLINKDNLTLSEWNTLTVNEKNYMTAKMLLQKQILSTYRAEDITVRIDAYVQSGIEEEPDKKTIYSILLLLQATDSLKKGDFREKVGVWYSKKDLVLIPLFN
ncbi:hypothetical protein L1765_05785 [Microaerobacter geothermalis]|uniref:hypothetical protein n=1 Tax=Microaerobacter geothermalis TaxID=674972 RepID=UPI001F30EFA3|nr:hypothetical protein [Microaerobacter geothermalis]MCF6093497.1 hypothetical protein [Microaerobacter geothermalis]